MELERLRWDTFESFYRDYRRELFRSLAAVLRDVDLAQEATDEAMVRTFQRWRVVKRYQNPKGWTYRVGLNWARSRLRKTRREIVGLGSWDDPGTTQTHNTELSKQLLTLSLPMREVVVFRYLFELSTAQTARMLDISEGTVKSRLHRALNRLRKEAPNGS